MIGACTYIPIVVPVLYCACSTLMRDERVCALQWTIAQHKHKVMMLLFLLTIHLVFTKTPEYAAYYSVRNHQSESGARLLITHRHKSRMTKKIRTAKAGMPTLRAKLKGKENTKKPMHKQKHKRKLKPVFSDDNDDYVPPEEVGEIGTPAARANGMGVRGADSARTPLSNEKQKSIAPSV